MQGNPGSISLGRRGVVAGDQVNRFPVGGQENGMNAMIAAGCHAAQLFDLVELIVPIRVGYAIQAALHFPLIVIDPDVEGIEGPQQTIGGADIGRHLLDVLGLQGLPGGWRRKAIEATELVARYDASLAVHAKVDPRALLGFRHGVEQFDFKSLGNDQLVDRRGRGFELSVSG